jgi:pimeloyl-ACP methyl ester carboxylesterase
VNCPVYFVLGRQDQMTSPKVTRDLGTALKARIHTLDCGHAIMQEQPEGMLQALAAALA